MGRFLAHFAELPSNVAQFTANYRLHHNLAQCSNFEELKLILHRLTPPRPLKDPVFHVKMKTPEIIYNFDTFQTVLDRICGGYTDVELVVLRCLQGKKKDPNA